MMQGQAKPDYWSSYYSEGTAPQLPSQFALFVANELATGQLPAVRSIVDIGCGNGRDSLFFAQIGHRLIAVDQSTTAIATFEQRLAGMGQEIGTRARLWARRVDDLALWADLDAALPDGPVLLYARFVLHAMDEPAESRLLDGAADLLNRRGGALCIEARSLRDQAEEKVTPSHFRRFIDPAVLADKVRARNLSVTYQVEGRGMAKYLADDAYVFRVLAHT